MIFVICIIAALLDALAGDPIRWHPVIWIGSVIAFLEKRLNRGRFRMLKGAVTAFGTVLLTGTVVLALVLLAKEIHIAVWFVVEVVLVSVALAQRSLKEAALVVSNALEREDLPEAREKLGWIVGRDTDELEEPEIVRGVIETVSENTSDGVTAPLFYALLFGATGAWCYKAVNTLDSMIAYRNERYEEFGYVAAKLDDVANFAPSRLTGLFILIGTKSRFKQSLSIRLKQWVVDARKHPSPNSGFLEAATAWQLGIRLGGYNRYGARTSFRAYMGEPREEMNRRHVRMAIRHMYASTFYMLVFGGILYAISYAWR